ncbi:MAG: hypothetical protein AAF597_09265, partial [Bacteroidota bacterium]
RRNTSLGLQPRVNFRLGQGDLALAASAGMVSHRNQTIFQSPELGRVVFSASPLVNFYHDVKLSYTYWPTAHFGVEINLIRTDMYHQSDFDPAGNYDLSPDNFINPTQAFAPESFQFTAGKAEAYFVGLAIVHRW